MDKCAREKETLYQLQLSGINEAADGFYMIDNEAESYFEPYSESNYLMEYYFETLPQLREVLSETWKGEEYMQNIIRTILSAAMKNKPLEENGNVRQDAGERIPTYIYNF